jgi:heme A synthase
MSEFFFNAHAIWQYVVLVAVVVALVVAFRGPTMDRTAETIYRITAGVVGLQVLLGIIVWIVNSGWSLGFMQGWVHPILGIAAVAVLNIFIGRARKGDPEIANRTVRTGLIVAVVLVVAAIGIGETA